jgi:predicted dehydrogenase
MKTPDKTGRLWEADIGGGALLDLGVYPLNFAAMFLGADITGIKSSGKIEKDVDVDDNIAITWANGATANLSCSLIQEKTRTAVITGSKGRISVDDFWFAQHIIVENESGTVRTDCPFDVNGYEYELRAAAQAINEGRVYCDKMPWEETLRIMGIMDAMREGWGLSYPGELLL